MATITIKNLDKLTAKLNNMSQMDVKKTMTKAVTLVHGEAKSRAPVDSGDLAGSIHMDVDKTSKGYEGRVYTNLEYAPYVEFGTGVKGNGTYPYEVEGLTLTYKDKGWCYWSDKEDKLIYTKGQIAQPYMYPALKTHERRIRKLFKEGVKDKLRDYCKGGK
ncbi:HK97 gp10 family phage protein [bacterium]|nr:HK97 gp10 family phage protein [bacterium]